MRAALLLVDLQQDFLRRPGLTPPPAVLTSAASTLLQACRLHGIPVLHAHSVYRADGSDRMPHWKRDDYRACVEGTDGASAPPALTAAENERVVIKKYYSAFGNAELEEALKAQRIDTLIIAGIYSHACVSSAVLDAYQRGLAVWVASEAIGSTDSLKSFASRDFLEGRAATYLETEEIIRRLGGQAAAPHRVCGPGPGLPVAHVGGHWIEAGERKVCDLHDPCDLSIIRDRVAVGTAGDAGFAAAKAREAGAAMAMLPVTERAGFLGQCREQLMQRRGEIVHIMCAETAKPLFDANEEFDRALGIIDTLQRNLEDGAASDYRIDAGTCVRYCPVGLILAITPWNNPLAIPLSKLAPALAFGNSVVWKPAMEAPRSSMALVECLEAAGIPKGSVSMLFGDATTAQALLQSDAVDAVTLTGSTATGKLAAAACSVRLTPLQAELGGNNAALVMAGCDIESAAQNLATQAFSFSGQRCTALRRIIVEANIAAEFTEALAGAVAALPLGRPARPGTRIGPLVSSARQQYVAGTVASALGDGAELICGGRIPPAFSGGCWFEPTLLRVHDCNNHVFQNETFGPVAVVHATADLDSALQACNAVAQGLVAALYSQDPVQQARFLADAKAGILRINPESGFIHADAPFGGWKDSGYGIPEHGIWNRDFYTKPQAIYA